MSTLSASCTLQSFTLPQLRAATQAGGVTNVIVKGQGDAFFIQIQMRSAQTAILITSKSRQPRQFRNPVQAFAVLREIGIMTGQFDVAHYSPEQKQTPSRVLRKVTEAPKPVSQPWESFLQKMASSPQATFDGPNFKLDSTQAQQLYERGSPIEATTAPHETVIAK
ncbi:hypothetical protein ACLPHM_05475 [Paenalcaligenes sp. Me131]|uniref:hypothetical protein n=1 Tax=Paenalcaligenes sp. Me131 TaxID=3392636 RepID=UPI003D27E898